jgi:hypothetical protein
LLNLLALCSLFLFCTIIVRLLNPYNRTELLLIAYVATVAHLVAIGLLLSSATLLGQIRNWTVMSSGFTTLLLVLGLAFPPTRKRILTRVAFPSGGLSRLAAGWRQDLSPFARTMLLFLVTTTASIGLLNLVLVVRIPPHNWDSMTYHLPRMAYYLQHNSLAFFDANYWAQVVHPKNATILLIFTYLVSGANENLMQSVQFVSYCVAMAAAYGIARSVNLTPFQSIAGALVFALLPVSVLEATTTQNDMIMAALIGTAAYFLLAWNKRQNTSYLALAASAVGLAAGTKESVIVALLPLALIFCVVILRRRAALRSLTRTTGSFLLATGLALCLFALPSGYLENLSLFDSLYGPPNVRQEHSYQNVPATRILALGSMNMLRYGFDFLSLDGLPPVKPVQQAQSILRAAPVCAIQSLGIDIENSEGTRTGFRLEKLPVASEDHSFWGILGFGLIWVSVLLSATGIVPNPGIRLLAVCTILYLLGQSFIGPYDPWRGRYFLTIAVLAAPLAGITLSTRSPLIRAYLAAVLTLGCISSITAVVYKSQQPLVAVTNSAILAPSFFDLDRIEQLTVSHPVYTAAIRKFDTSVPPDAVVALSLKKNSYEYPLFGSGLTRTLVPVNSFLHGPRPLPYNAEYLLYDSTYASPRPGDTHLGVDWYLRRIQTPGRE